MRRSKIVLGSVMAVVSAGGGTALAAGTAPSPTDASNVIHGCWTTAAIQGTHAFVLQDAGSSCPRGTTPISWNQTGPAGPQGLQGPKGDPGTTGPQGPAGNDGAPGAQGAAGNDGAPGKDGATGKDGESAYLIWLNAGNTGTQTDFLNSLKGQPGVQGPQGEKGDPAPAAATKLSTYFLVSEVTGSGRGTPPTVVACNTGDLAIAGQTQYATGAAIGSVGTGSVVPNQSSWVFSAGGTGAWSFDYVVTCLHVGS